MVKHMKNGMHTARMLFGAVFLTVLIGYSAANLALEWESLSEEVTEEVVEEGLTPPEDVLTALDGIVSEELLGRRELVDTYGTIQLLLGKKEDGAFDTVKDKAGFLYSGNFWSGFGPDQKEFAVRVRRLQDMLEKSGTKLAVVIYPRNTPEPEDRCLGIPYDDDLELVENFASWLRYYGVPVLELSNFCELTSMAHEDAFFRTDRHWTPAAAFEGFVRILEFLNGELAAELDPAHTLRDLGSYESKTYPKAMLGSNGRAAGITWAGGAEDFTVIYPREVGHYTLRWGDLHKQKTLEGSFTETLLDIQSLEHPPENIYSGTAESAYLQSGVSAFTSIRNHGTEAAGKLLLIRDSFSTVVGAFLSQSFSQTDMVWNIRIKEAELSALLAENHYDYVLVAISPSNLVENAFPFGTKEAE